MTLYISTYQLHHPHMRDHIRQCGRRSLSYAQRLSSTDRMGAPRHFRHQESYSKEWRIVADSHLPGICDRRVSMTLHQTLRQSQSLASSYRSHNGDLRSLLEMLSRLFEPEQEIQNLAECFEEFPTSTRRNLGGRGGDGNGLEWHYLCRTPASLSTSIDQVLFVWTLVQRGTDSKSGKALAQR